MVADSGYDSEQNYEYLEGAGIDAYVKYDMFHAEQRRKGKADRRTMEVNHKNDMYRAKARELLTSELGLYHRSMRPIEPEAVFGQIKYDHRFKRFKLKSLAKVSVEFGLVALAHNMRKYIAATKARNEVNAASMKTTVINMCGKLAA